jgi:pimeloyl-ACP methyl ester carboxylesterase
MHLSPQDRQSERAGPVSRLSFTDRYVVLPDVQLHYVDYGGSGVPLLALHGYVQNAHAYDGIAPAVVPTHRLLALDLRGRGRSEWSAPTRYRWIDYFRDLHGFVNSLGLSRFALLGTSMGGTLAMMYAMAYPDRVSQLVLNDISLDADPVGVANATRRVARAPRRFSDLSQAMTWFLEERVGLEYLDEASLRAWVSHFVVPAPSGGLHFNCDPALIVGARHAVPAIERSASWTHHWAAWEQVKRLTMPVLLLRGERSDVVSRSSARRMVRVLPSAHCREIPRMGHAPTLYEPESRAAIREFVRSVPESG